MTKISANPSSSLSGRSSLTICAWIETSRLVVASSAMMQRGPAGQRQRDRDALPQSAGKLGGIALHPMLGLGKARHAEHFDGPRPRFVAACKRGGRGSTSVIWCSTVISGLSAAVGS